MNYAKTKIGFVDTFKKPVFYGAIMGFVFGLISFLVELQAISKYGSSFVLAVSIWRGYGGIIVLISLLMILIFIVLTIIPSYRKWASRFLLGNVVFIVFLYLSILPAKYLRQYRYELLVERSQPLVNAIKAYTIKQGVPPKSLEQLVPSFLPEIPKYNMGANPKYRYLVGRQAMVMYDQNPWVLLIEIKEMGECDLTYFPEYNLWHDNDGRCLK